MKSFSLISAFAGLLLPSAVVVVACGDDGGHDCYGPTNAVQHVRQVKRMQPEAEDAEYGPKGPLEWGQVNFLHTTDTHGWLEGHVKEKNYGADWGDFVTFSRRMKQKAGNMGADLLLIDTGDLHDGTGLSDASEVDGEKSMPIFDEIDYDLLTIGNHELYVSDITKQMFKDYASKWGDRYLTSNVKIYDEETGKYDYLGATHRYFATKHGLRIMAFGVLFDFTGNSNASKVLTAKQMVKQSWFKSAVSCESEDPIDLFLLIGHNPARATDSSSTFKTVWDAIRKEHPKTPIQIFGGHSHIRDFAVYDESSVALESGRYCETLGWASLSGFDKSNSGFHGVKNPHGVPNPCRPAVEGSKSPFLYSRRYLDWNRKTFVYHSNKDANKFDYHSGLRVTDDITDVREDFKLNEVYGCVPQSYCFDCAPFESEKNIFEGVIKPAVKEIVVNKDRKNKPRIILGNTGVIRFDLYKGPYTYDDNFIVSPFRDIFLYIKDVPWAQAKKILGKLNAGPIAKRNLASMPMAVDECINPSLGSMSRRDMDTHEPRGVIRRQETLTAGYITTDDFGDDGDDTKHSNITRHELPAYWEARAAFPEDGEPETVDVVFFDFIQSYVLDDLDGKYTDDDVDCFVDCDFSSQDFLLPYAKKVWQKNVDDCPI